MVDNAELNRVIEAAEDEADRIQRLVAEGDLDLTVEREYQERLDTLRRSIEHVRALLVPVGGTPHVHEWHLAEDGYTRTWDTEITSDGKIVATFTGSEDWTEEGDGVVYLACAWCVARRELTEAEVQGITYR